MIEGVVNAALKGLVANRCYPVIFPQNEAGDITIAWPAIRYTIVSSDNPADICGTDSMDTDDTRVQIDVVAKTHGAAVTLRDQVITAMMGLSPPAVRVGNGFQGWDSETKTYRIILDYLFTASSGGGSP